MVDLIHLQQDRLDDIVADQLEAGVSKVMHHVFLPPGEEVIDHDHVIPPGKQLVHQMAPDESGASGHNDPLRRLLQPHRHPPPTATYGNAAAGGGGGGERGVAYAGEEPFVQEAIGGVEKGKGGVVGMKQEEGGSDDGAGDDEYEALLAEEVPGCGAEEGRGGGSGGGRPGGGLGRLGGVGGDLVAGLLVELLHRGIGRLKRSAGGELCLQSTGYGESEADPAEVLR